MTKYFSFFALLLLCSCAEAPTKFDRNNLNDPEAPKFELEAVHNFSTEILDNKIIEISWVDTSTFATNHILSKKVSASSQSKVLDTLNAGIQSYVDRSNEIDETTTYEIQSYRRQESDSLIYSRRVTTGLEFGGIASSTVQLNADSTAFIFEWEFETEWPFIGIVFEFDNDSGEELPIDTVFGSGQYTTPVFEKDFEEKYFEIKFYTSEESTSDTPYENITGIYQPLDLTPEITTIDVLNEAMVVINWEDNSHFEEGFQILRAQGFNLNQAGEPEVIATVPPNTTSFTDTLNPLIGYVENEFGGNTLIKTYYGIQALKNETQIGSFGSEAEFEPPTVSLYADDFSSTSLSLGWQADDYDKVNSFELQKSTDGINFIDYKTFDNLTTSSLEQNLDKDRIHYFRLRSKTSGFTEVVTVKYSTPLVIETEIDFPEAYQLEFSESGKKIVASAGFAYRTDSPEVLIYDLDLQSTLYKGIPTGSPITGVDIDEGNKLIALSSGPNDELSIIDYESNTIVLQKTNIKAFDIKFSPNKNFVFSNSCNGVVKKINVNTGEELFSTNDFSTSCSTRSLSISPTGDSIAYNYDGFFKLLNSSTAEPIEFDHVLDYGGTSQNVSFAQNGKYIANVSDFDQAEIHSTETNSRYLLTRANHISISYDNSYYVTGYRNSLNLYDFESKESEANGFGLFTGDILDLTFSTVQNQIALSTKEKIYIIKISNDKKWGVYSE
ncbi:WD40 repeat domain-containing protein [Gracilimonas sp. BCB1]|uniref:WD40 repeat domain-containing protein n=1 Tax=Gracilimonas sp. BCB1 TaxID=3152362 RepID=UPI0032D94367